MAEADDKSTYGDPRNDKVTAARRRTESPTYAGQCLSRQELGDLVAAHVYRHHGQTLVSDANWVGKLERGEITWPRKPQRAALRAILGAPNDEGATEIHQVIDAAGVFSSWDQIYGSGPTRAAVREQLRWSAGLLDGSCPETLRSDLYSAVGYLGHTCGMIAFDAYEHDDAHRAFCLALACADAAGNWHLRAKVYSSMARHAIWLGEPDEGLTSTEHALVRADRLTPTERAMLYTAKARALAKMQRVEDTRAAVGSADENFANSEPANDPPWMAYYDAAQHVGDTGHALWDLSMQGHPSEAADRLAAAVRGHPASFTRSRAISHTKLAALVMATGDPLEAAAIGSAALATAGTVRSRRRADDLRSLSGYAEPHGAIDEVAALRHQIATTLVGS